MEMRIVHINRVHSDTFTSEIQVQKKVPILDVRCNETIFIINQMQWGFLEISENSLKAANATCMSHRIQLLKTIR
jgi:hypothetical protein